MGLATMVVNRASDVAVTRPYHMQLLALALVAPLLAAPWSEGSRHRIHPVHESNIELCREVWRERPAQAERCLVARRDLVEALLRNPYARADEPVRAWCQRAGRGPGCGEDLLQEAARLSYYYNFLQAAIADAVMWQKPYRESEARGDLERLAWCDDKYMREADSIDYYSVRDCIYSGSPRTEQLWGFGPRE